MSIEPGGRVDPKLRARLEAELPALHTRLLAKAVLLVRQSGWRMRFGTNRQAAAEDLLQAAVLRALTGDRRWNPNEVDLWGFLVGAMRSMVNAATRSPENRTKSFDEPAEDGGTRGASFPHDVPSAEDVIGQAEDDRAREEAIYAAAGDDAVLLKYVEALMDGVEKPADIAERMGVKADVVYQAHRKLRRRLEALGVKEVQDASA